MQLTEGQYRQLKPRARKIRFMALVMDVVGIGRTEEEEKSDVGATVPMATVPRGYCLYEREGTWCYWDREERVEGSGGGATAPARATVSRGTVHKRERGRGLAARAVRCAGNVGRGASSTVAKREDFSF
jgi:hypothetical protein